MNFLASDPLRTLESPLIVRKMASSTANSGPTTYSYLATDHRLQSVGTVARGYDNNGNTTSIGGTAKAFVFDDTNRMSQVKASGTTVMNYAYNGKGEQVRRYLTTSTYTVYDEAGRWLGDYDNSGASIQEAVWLDDLPVGVASDKLYSVEPDHLGTPRAVIDSQRDVTVWRWDLNGEAFGNTTPNQNPDLDGTNFVFNLRYPGQRYDSASGLNYNYFRDYDAVTGRYAESDPIGLKGGASTFAYAAGSPMRQTDPKGLFSFGPSCSSAQRIQISSEIVQLANELKEKARSRDCEKGDCDWSLARDAMAFIAQEAIFSCNLGYPCEAIWGLDRLVYIYPPLIGAPSASEINSPGKCGCFRSTIFHEAAHKVRYDLDENAIRRKTLQCVPCATNRTDSGGPL